MCWACCSISLYFSFSFGFTACRCNTAPPYIDSWRKYRAWTPRSYEIKSIQVDRWNTLTTSRRRRWRYNYYQQWKENKSKYPIFCSSFHCYKISNFYARVIATSPLNTYQWDSEENPQWSYLSRKTSPEIW